jgi:ADP-ribosylglycohydrolase
MQTLECKEDGNNERVVDDRSRGTVLCAAAAAALGRASERKQQQRGLRKTGKKQEYAQT